LRHQSVQQQRGRRIAQDWRQHDSEVVGQLSNDGGFARQTKSKCQMNLTSRCWLSKGRRENEWSANEHKDIAQDGEGEPLHTAAVQAQGLNQ
jgi:hypothetical protein